MMRAPVSAVIATLAISLGTARAEAPGDAPREPDLFAIHPLTGLLENTGASFVGWNALYHAGGVMATVGLAASDVDADIQEAFQRHDPLGGQVVGDIVYVGGYIAPLATGVSLWIAGLADADQELIGAGSAAIQAVAVTSLVVGAEKLLTGRRGPLQPDCAVRCNDPADRTASAGDFALDVWNHDPFATGRTLWPSGHTASAFALVSSLTAYYPDEAWIPAVGYPLAAFIGVGMIEGDHHWPSDVIAGALTGQAIGWTVGSSFRAAVDGAGDEGRAGGPRLLYVAPVVHGLGAGLRVGGAL
jgi:membrane-associated phospholipid phosphatase